MRENGKEKRRSLNLFGNYILDSLAREGETHCERKGSTSTVVNGLTPHGCRLRDNASGTLGAGNGPESVGSQVCNSQTFHASITARRGARTA
jgi:hypothetical protein